MKKAFAILLLAIYLFNVYGYRVFFSLIENAADKQMIVSLDNNNYNENDLKQIKFALNTPYIQSNSSYERCDGKVEFNGVAYNYVKRMVHNDTLYLYCIPNKEKTNISNTKNLYAKQNSDNPAGKSGQPVLKKINFFNEYNSGALSFNFNTYYFSPAQTFTFNNIITLKGFTTKHLQPPDLFI